MENTGNWDTYKEVSLGSADLAAKGITKGEHTLKLMIAGSYVNVDWLKFSEKTTSAKKPELVMDSPVEYKVFNLQGKAGGGVPGEALQLRTNSMRSAQSFPTGVTS